MRTHLIILPSPLLYQDLSFFQSREYFPIRKLVPQLSIKRFNISVFPGTTRFHKQSLHTQAVKPSSHCFSGKLRAIIRTYMLWSTTKNEKLEDQSAKSMLKYAKSVWLDVLEHELHDAIRNAITVVRSL